MIASGFSQATASAITPVFLLHQVSGMFAGPGYVALFGLIALKISEAEPTRAGRSVVAAIAALGQRSLSGYLCQSVAWLMTLAPFTLALGARFHIPMLTGIAIALLVWLLTVVAASFLSRRGRPGPAEAVLRRLTYGAAS